MAPGNKGSRAKRAAKREAWERFQSRKSLDFLFAPAEKKSTVRRILDSIWTSGATRLFIRLLIVLALCLAVAVPAYTAFRNVVTQDEAAPLTDENLRIKWHNVGRADNGYFLVVFLDSVASKLKRQKFSMPPEWPAEDDQVHGASGLFDPHAAKIILEQNSGALKRFDACLEADHFVVPWIDPTAAGASQTTLISWKNLGHLARCRSRYLYETGERARAINETLKIVHFGQRVAHSQAGIRTYLVGSQLSQWGVNSILWLINENEYRPAELTPLTVALRSYLKRGFGLEESFRADYTKMRTTIDRWAESMALGHGINTGGLELDILGQFLPPDALFKPNETRRKLMEGFGLAVSWTHLSYSDRPGDAEAERLLAESSGTHETARLNSIGNTVVRTTLSALPPALAVDERLRFQLDALVVTAALHAYKKANGALPETLAELVPTYLEAVPQDPADGNPMRYSAQKKILYSIGSDREDGGGSVNSGVNEALTDILEPTFRLRF